MVSARLARFAVVFGCLSFPVIAAAEEVAVAPVTEETANAARSLFERGVEGVKRKAWAEAAGYFERSASIVPRRSTLYNLALCRYHLEQHVPALEVIDRLAASGEPPDAGTQALADKLRERALGKVMVVDVTVEPPEATIAVDGAAVAHAPSAARSLYLAPGSHEVSVSSPGRVPVRFSLEGRGGQSFARSVALAVVPPAESAAPQVDPRPPPAAVVARRPEPNHGVGAHWILLGAGSLLLASAAVTGVMAWSADSDFVEACPSLRECDPSDRHLKDRAQSLATASDVLLGLGLATTGVGAVLLWRAGSSNGDRAIGLQLQGSL